MNNLYQKILNKPESYRRRLTYAITAFLGIIIFTIWLAQVTVSIKKTFSSSKEKNQEIENIKKTMPSLQTDNLKELENIIPKDEQTQPATDTTDTGITTQDIQNGIDTFDIKGLEMKTPEGTAGTTETAKEDAALRPAEK